MAAESQPELFGMTPAGPLLVFDLETQRSFAEVGGRDHLRDLKISVAVTQELPAGTFRTYFESDLANLVEALFGATLVVGFNVKRFDYPVLSAYTERPLATIPTLDILEEFERAMGFRVKLDALAEASLGCRKTADGLAALRWFKEGKLDEIARYCREDVRITAEIYRFGKEKGFVRYPARDGQIRQCPARW